MLISENNNILCNIFSMNGYDLVT